MHKVKGGTFESTSYKDSYEDVLKFAGGLLSLGICRGDHIGLISDNRCEWQRADLGLLAIGAIDIPRGCDATISDLEYILSITECKTVIVENENQVRKIIGIKENLKNLKNFIIFESPSDKIFEEAKAASIELISYEQVLEKGKKFNNENPGKVEDEMEKGKGDDLASIIFTSGTTGNPKGVMLSHKNLVSDCFIAQTRMKLYETDVFYALLPIHHAYTMLAVFIETISVGAEVVFGKSMAVSKMMKELKEGKITIQEFKQKKIELSEKYNIPGNPKYWFLNKSTNEELRKEGFTAAGVRRFDRQAKSTIVKNLVISMFEGLALGLGGMGIPDIPIFVSVMLKSIYEIAISFGFDYTSDEEKLFILNIIDTSLKSGDVLRKKNEEINIMIDHMSEEFQNDSDEQVVKLMISRQVDVSAEALSKELLYGKFIQGKAVIGIVGGINDVTCLKKVTDYAVLKYKRRFLIKYME